MTYSIRDTQARCAALGHSPGAIDGMMGPKTRAAISAALQARGGHGIADLFHPSGLHRIHWHWTAGAYGVIDMERRAYNELIDQDGNVWDGLFRPEAQANYRVGRAASHTLDANTGAIGLSVDAMAGAQERPFFAGRAPVTWPQVHALCERTAQHCAMYDIPVSRWSVLSHAEIQPTLGIRQRNKWDITWLPDMSAPGDPVQIGDRLRDMVIERMQDARVAA
ncbi:peptidoglycan-binding domain-containing protein [Oceaniglobus trochenteri]|uniref:peptidoglycan-binding domain-containing protein n=1 Tax=Oceaniglobus trochenteri TaxID=2763260 RepID=UPI001CFF8CC3|nr:N-acetylmuramoyl-L-alanine amidase [Oceaniglobus trochenteri]